MLPTQDRLLLALHSLYREYNHSLYRVYNTYVWTHACIIEEAGSPRILKSEARHGLKVLRTQGFAVHTTNFSSDEPEVRGSGCYITHEGIIYLQEKGLI